MKFIFGLGNPGKEYVYTRHNIGFMVTERVADLQGVKFKLNKRFDAFVAQGLLKGNKYLIAKPQTFMNLSGHSVSSIIRWYDAGINDVLLIVDDISLPFGDIKIKAKGSDAGHKGLRSVVDHLGSNGFSRLKVGIKGREDIKDLSNYVLRSFTKTEQKILPDILDRSSSAVECWIREGVDQAMNQYNGGY